MKNIIKLFKHKPHEYQLNYRQLYLLKKYGYLTTTNEKIMHGAIAVTGISLTIIWMWAILNH